MTLGSQDQNEIQIQTKVIQNVQPDTRETNWIRQIPEEKLGQRIYQTVTITYGITFLFCQEEGQKASTLPRLLISK
jgi:hypothetical protein